MSKSPYLSKSLSPHLQNGALPTSYKSQDLSPSPVIPRLGDSVPSWHGKVHQTCRRAEPRAPGSWLKQVACPAQISSPGAGAEAGRTCWMSSSSCSRCSRETLYSSSRTSAKYSVLWIDSFSFTVRMMSCHTERHEGHLRSRPALLLRHRTGRPSLTFSLFLGAAGERKACAHWVQCQLRQLNLDRLHMALLMIPHGPAPTPQATHTTIFSCFTWKTEATHWGLRPLFKVPRFISLESAPSTGYQIESHRPLCSCEKYTRQSSPLSSQGLCCLKAFTHADPTAWHTVPEAVTFSS